MPGTEGKLPGASIVGPDGVPATGSASLSGGVIRCEKTTTEAAALSLPVTLDATVLASIGQVRLPDGSSLSPLGELVLQTCLLPERDKAYALTLELARHRMMLILNKLEEWRSFEIALDGAHDRII
ncbi:MAG: hypothetical protein AAGA55_07945, partial [Planctomycetota bacterium]